LLGEFNAKFGKKFADAMVEIKRKNSSMSFVASDTRSRKQSTSNYVQRNEEDSDHGSVQISEMISQQMKTHRKSSVHSKRSQLNSNPSNPNLSMNQQESKFATNQQEARAIIT